MPADIKGKVMPSSTVCGRIIERARRPLEQARQVRVVQGRQEREIKDIHDGHEYVVKQERSDADDCLDERVNEERSRISPPEIFGKPGTESEAPHEDDQHQRLRVRGVTEKQFQVVRPDRLVDRPRTRRS